MLERLFYAYKLLQAVVFAIWCLHFGAITGWRQTWMSPVGAMALGLIACGQLLNLAVFARLGRTGVFYGNRLGHASPW